MRRSLLVAVITRAVMCPAGQALDPSLEFTQSKPQDSTMGLAISRSTVESHGSRLWAVPNDGRSVTLNFTLPSEIEAPDEV